MTTEAKTLLVFILSMYSTCLFCNKDLGKNETFETFPIGERLAFDAAKGRLWVVCPSCERWNLTPLEERWEAIESAEKLFRDARQRVSTDNIGLAKLRDGTTLVRIGEAQRPEFAAWRYGDQFGRRRRRQMLVASAGIGALGALAVGGMTAGVSIGGFAWLLSRASNVIVRGNPETVVARVKTAEGKWIKVLRRHLLLTSISPGSESPFAIDLRFVNGESHFEGPEAMRIASVIVPAANRFGGNKEMIARAVGTIEESGGAAGFLDRISQVAAVTTRGQSVVRRSRVEPVIYGGLVGFQLGRVGSWGKQDWSTGIFGMTPVQRLALEMALHEDAERIALQGELEQLERAWRDAEEVAAISDDLLVPDGVTGALNKLRGKT